MKQAIGENSYLIDTGLYRPNHAACYLIEDNGELAVIDTGTQHSVQRVLNAIDALGAKPDQVRYVIPTHVHLDHAGGAGQLMAACAEASLVVHPKGQTHMIDPSKLQAGATAVYGEEAFQRDFGTLMPIDEDRTLAADDLQTFELGNRRLQFLHTPGHANHHGCIFDHQSGYLYTGDTFGLGYTEFRNEGEPLLVATTTPVAFDPEAWLGSLDHIMSMDPQACCLTHFGKIDNPDERVDQLRTSIEAHVKIALDEEPLAPEGRAERLHGAVYNVLVSAGLAHSDLSEEEVRAIFASDIDLNAQGLAVWLVRRAKKRA